MFEFVAKHQFGAAAAIYWIFSAAVSAMPEPSPYRARPSGPEPDAQSHPGYLWLYRFAHTMAGNITTVFGGRIPGLKVLGLLLAASLVLLAQGCAAHYTVHPAALNQTDSAAYDALLIAETVIDQAKFANPLIYPQHDKTPGVTNPLVSQANIQDNICKKGFSTDAYRPESSYTSELKKQQLAEYGHTVPDPRKQCMPHSDNPKCYEEDHLISLETGGHPSDPRNLWPQPTNKTPGMRSSGWQDKDKVEDFIHDLICHDIPNSPRRSKIHTSHSITLERGQEILANDWYVCAQTMATQHDCK